jgi:aryl-alcohol dehydrogenase-like predicted oxidoreductase
MLAMMQTCFKIQSAYSFGGALSEVSSETRFLHAIEMGLGAWQWGDRIVWQYGHGWYGGRTPGFQTSVHEGIILLTRGTLRERSFERLLGRFLKETDQPVLIATKFFPLPWRFRKAALPRALKGSLSRIGIENVDLYQIHWPSLLMSTETTMEGLAECVKSGMARTAGVSNFGQSRMLAAYSALARHNIPLASNQLHYSLLNRAVEKNGTLARCKELGIRLIAYSPLEKGLLTGKYSVDRPPPGSRARSYTNLLGKIQPLIKLMTEIGQDHGGKSNAQISMNWLICKGTLIPGQAAQAQKMRRARLE